MGLSIIHIFGKILCFKLCENNKQLVNILSMSCKGQKEGLTREFWGQSICKNVQLWPSAGVLFCLLWIKEWWSCQRRCCYPLPWQQPLFRPAGQLRPTAACLLFSCLPQGTRLSELPHRLWHHLLLQQPTQYWLLSTCDRHVRASQNDWLAMQYTWASAGMTSPAFSWIKSATTRAATGSVCQLPSRLTTAVGDDSSCISLHIWTGPFVAGTFWAWSKRAFDGFELWRKSAYLQLLDCITGIPVTIPAAMLLNLSRIFKGILMLAICWTLIHSTLLKALPGLAWVSHRLACMLQEGNWRRADARVRICAQTQQEMCRNGSSSSRVENASQLFAHHPTHTTKFSSNIRSPKLA